MMHHNLNVSIERSNTSYVGHIEVSTSGTANRANVTADTFAGILAALKEKEAEFVKAAESFHGAPAHSNITHPSEGLQRQVASVEPDAPKAKGGKGSKGGKGGKSGKKGAKAKAAKAAKGKPAPKAKEKPRKFASE